MIADGICERLSQVSLFPRLRFTIALDKIQTMHRLRNALQLTRLVLVWFALSVGVAIASPVVNPKGVDMVCSSAGVMKLVVQGDDDGVASSLTMDCATPCVQHHADSTLPSGLCLAACRSCSHCSHHRAPAAIAWASCTFPLIFKAGVRF
jgi:hypothetical protein